MTSFASGLSLHAFLEKIYTHFNHSRFRTTDPVQFLYRYRTPFDREVAAFLSSAFAFGRIRQFCAVLSRILDRLGPHPARTIVNGTFEKTDWTDCAHRFASSSHLHALLKALQSVLKRHGSLENALAIHWQPTMETVEPAIKGFLREFPLAPNPLLPCTNDSACKRLHLFLRWMVRKDAIDAGLWEAIPPRALIVPLDTHMARIGTALGFTQRRSPGKAMALEITDQFRHINPQDPVKYDFALTRMGMIAPRKSLSFATPS